MMEIIDDIKALDLPWKTIFITSSVLVALQGIACLIVLITL